eukprot:621439-Rhodomonas_salina.1
MPSDTPQRRCRCSDMERVHTFITDAPALIGNRAVISENMWMRRMRWSSALEELTPSSAHPTREKRVPETCLLYTSDAADDM